MATADAAELDRPVGQVAPACAMARPGIASTLMGASKLDQLASNIAAVEIALSNDQLHRLNEVGSPAATFSASLVTPQLRRMVYGWQTVTGWRE